MGAGGVLATAAGGLLGANAGPSPPFKGRAHAQAGFGEEALGPRSPPPLSPSSLLRAQLGSSLSAALEVARKAARSRRPGAKGMNKPQAVLGSRFPLGLCAL